MRPLIPVNPSGIRVHGCRSALPAAGTGGEEWICCLRWLGNYQSATFTWAGGERHELPGSDVPDNVHCHGYLVPKSVAGFLARADVLVAPYGEQVAAFGDRGDIAQWFSPLKVFEYLAAGRAIVASDLPALREVLRDGENARLVAPGAAPAWVEALRQLDQNRALLQQLGAAARTDFVSHYSWLRRAQRYQSFIETQLRLRAVQ